MGQLSKEYAKRSGASQIENLKSKLREIEQKCVGGCDLSSDKKEADNNS